MENFYRLELDVKNYTQHNSLDQQEGNGPIDWRVLDNDESMITDSKYGLIFEISSFNYSDIHGHLVSNREPLRPW